MAQRSRLSTRLRLAPTRYEPKARIAAGGMAEVWRAMAVFEQGDRAPVAIKRVLPHLAQDPMFLSMFEDEARLGMMLRHPNVVRVYDARHVGGTFLMIMELVDGAALKSLFEMAEQRKMGMPLLASLHIIRELAAGLDYAHGATDPAGQSLGLIHRDVSPHNLLLGKDGAVKLADFGLADSTSHSTAKSKDLVGGKIGYLAPEVILQRPPDPRIDVFAAAIVLWEMLAGRRLFSGKDDPDTLRLVVQCKVEPPSVYNPNVPKAVDDLVLRALARNPDDRTRSAAALSDELTAVIQNLDPRVGPRDVSLLVSLFLANEKNRPPPPPPGVAELLASELDQFAEQAQGHHTDLGAAPLDPSQFGRY